MAAFVELNQKWEDFQKIVNDNFPELVLFEEISVEQPTPPENELHFIKLVAWSYVLLIESFPVLYKQITSMLRSSDVLSLKRVGEVFLSVHALRTVQGHNLKVSSTSDQKKLTLATIWKAKYGGPTTDWPACCDALCTQMIEVITILRETVQKSMADAGDFGQFQRELQFSIERNWEAHNFDRIIEGAAKAVGIKGLDVKKYRESRIKEWQDSVSLFATRIDAEEAISRLIKAELRSKFGGLQKRDAYAPK